MLDNFNNSAVSALYATAAIARSAKDYKAAAEATLAAAKLWQAIGGKPSMYSCGLDAARDYALLGDAAAMKNTIDTWVRPNKYQIKTVEAMQEDIRKVCELLVAV